MNEARYREAERRLWASEGVAAPLERRLHLARIGVDVRVQEVGSGPAVLFVHGATNGGTSWAPLVSRLAAKPSGSSSSAAGFRCLLLDRPGCGLSEPLKSSFSNVARVEAFGDTLIVDVLDALDVDRADVVATSLGGYVALRSAAAQPDRIGRVMAFGWSLGAPMAKTPFAMRLSAIPLFGRLSALMPMNERAVRALLRNIGLGNALKHGHFTQEAVDWYLALLRDTDTLRNEVSVWPRVISPFRGMNESMLLPESLLAKVQAPVHLLWGEQDLFGGAETARQFVSKLPNAELELMPGGHAVWMDDADRAAAVTQRFLSGAGPLSAP